MRTVCTWATTLSMTAAAVVCSAAENMVRNPGRTVDHPLSSIRLDTIRDGVEALL